MDHEMMDLEQLATYLKRDVRELHKLASRGQLPGRKVGGRWRFASAEINHWIETQLPGYSAKELTALEEGHSRGPHQQPLLATILSESTMAVPLPASTRPSVLKELVTLAEQSWQVYDGGAILEAVRQREALSSTALPSGVAFPHPRRPLPAALGDAVLAYGRTASGIPFSAPDGSLTDIFFLVLCPDYGTHLRVLARLARMLMQPGLIEDLRQADSLAETFGLLDAAERELLEHEK